MKPVEPLAYGDEVLCSQCMQSMTPTMFRSIGATERTWIYWVCDKHRGHISCAIPLPHQFELKEQ